MRKVNLVLLFAALAAATAFSATRAVAAVGNIFIVNPQTGVVGEYTTDGATVNASLITGLTCASLDIAVSGPNLFVSGYSNPSGGAGFIAEYTTDGATVNARLVTGLDCPHGIAVSGSNLYFVEDNAAGTQSLDNYNLSTGVLSVLATPLSNGANGIAVSGGNVFISNPAADTISKYTTDGTLVNASLVTGLWYPYGIVASGGDVYVANTYPYGQIGEYTTDGAPVNTNLFQTGSYPAHYVHALGMFGGNLFTLDDATGAIGEYDAATGTYNADLVTGLGLGWGNSMAIEAAVPEPATIIVWSLLGAFAITVSLRRWRRSA